MASAADIDVALEALGDRTAYLKELSITLVVYTLNNTSTNPGVSYALTSEFEPGSAFPYTLVGGNTVQVGAAGIYRVSWSITLAATAPVDWDSLLKVGAASFPSSSPPFNSGTTTVRGGQWDATGLRR